MVILQLPFSAQQQAVLLPAELATRLASRFLARSIRGSIPKTTSRFSTVKVIKESLCRLLFR